LVEAVFMRSTTQSTRYLGIPVEIWCHWIKATVTSDHHAKFCGNWPLGV